MVNSSLTLNLVTATQEMLGNMETAPVVTSDQETVSGPTLTTVSLTASQVEGIIHALGMALDDQDHYVNYGNPAADYDSEGLESKAIAMEKLAAASLAFGLEIPADSFMGLAAEFREMIADSESA